MNPELLTVLFGMVTTVVSGVGWYKTTRRLKEAEASKAEEDVHAAQADNFDKVSDSLVDLVHALMAEVKDKTTHIREMTSRELALKEEIHELKMKLLSTRCDILGCDKRRPPLPWCKEEKS